MPQEQKMTMDQVRERFPEYDDMDDMSLANALHGKFYSDIPIAEFYASVGFNPETDAGDNGIYPEMRPGFSQDNPIDLATVDRATAAGMTRGTWVKGPDGTVYALPSDPVEGQTRVGDMPQAPGVNVRPFSAVEDVAKSFPTGVVEGLTGMAGMQGTIGQMLGGEVGQNLPGFGIVGPTGEQLNDQVREGLGRDYYQPQSIAGEYSRTAGEFLPGIVAPGGVGAKMASWLVPAATSETAGQLARALEGGERDTTAEGFARMGGGLIGGLGVGGVNAFRGGSDNVLRGAAEGVTPDQLALAAALRSRSPIPLTNAEALQQVTAGATGMGRVQRVVEGASPRLAPMMARRADRDVPAAIAGVLDQIGPSVEPSRLAPQVREASGGVLNTLRRRANEDAGQFYDRLPGQSLPPEQFQQLTENPSFAAALRSVRGDEELAPLLAPRSPPQRGVSLEGRRLPSSNSLVLPDAPTPEQMRAASRIERVPLASARRTQNNMDWERFDRGDSPGELVAGFGDRPVAVRREDGEYLIFDGNHRTVRAAEGGADDLEMYVIDAKDYAPDMAGRPATTSPPVYNRQEIDDLAAELGGMYPNPDNDLNVINEVVKQLDTMADEAAPNSMRVGGSNTRAAQRREARALADALAREASPDWRMARDTVNMVNRDWIDPLKAGPIGALADTSEAAPNLGAMTSRLFPAQPFEGQADETAQALRLMGEIDPSVPGPLVRQFLAQQAAEAGQANVGGANPFGGAKFAAQTFGNPLQRETVLGAVDAAAPMASRDIRDLVEALSATGQREAAGSNTSFNSAFLNKLEDGGVLDQAASLFTDPLGTPRRIQSSIRDWTAERNAQSLADLLVANSDEFSARLTRAINRPRGANRIRAGVAIGAGQED